MEDREDLNVRKTFGIFYLRYCYIVWILLTNDKRRNKMKATRSEALESYYLNKCREKVDNERTGIHASDLDGCLLKIYYRRTMKPPPGISKDSCLKFVRGWAVEQFVAPGTLAPIEKEGIICSLDDKLPLLGECEIKSTTKSMEGFDPLNTYYWWTTRMKTYCFAYGTKKINLVVFFLNGNYKDIRTDLRCWTLRFTDDELVENWVEMQRRAKILRIALETHEPMSFGEVHPLKFGKGMECDYCDLNDTCQFYLENNA